MRSKIQIALQQLVNDLFGQLAIVELNRPDEQFGDLTTNIALQLAKPLGRSPREIAAELAPHIEAALAGSVQAVAVAGPGFINLTLRDTVLIEAIADRPTQPLAGQTVVAEYSDPNPFKVLHAGHLYTTIVGDVVGNLLTNAGATVHRLNFGGDVGLHVGKCLWAIIQNLGGELPEKLAAIDPQQRAEWLSQRYIEGNTAYEDDPSARQAIINCNKRVYQLFAEDDHDSPFAQMYWTCRQWSYDGFTRLYEQLQVTPFERFLPESEVQVAGTEIVKQGLQDGVFTESDGAVIYAGQKDGLHSRVFLSSQGLPTYEAKDLGLAATKWRDYQFDLNVIITANDITEYMKVVLTALSHFYPEAAERTRHLTHGVIKLAGGVKMSSRKGNILRAEDVLQTARAAQLATTGAANEDAVLAAVKYAFLKQRIGGDIVYNPEESVAILGNTGPYLQYAHARARSILAKADQAASTGLKNTELTADERSLVRSIGLYSEAVELAIAELAPHHICSYLYELAQGFNRFYEHNRVLNDERQAVRLAIIECYAAVLQNGLGLLNIPAPDHL